MMLEDGFETLAMFARMRSVDAIVRSALLNKKQQEEEEDVITTPLDDDEELNNVKQKNINALDELQRTALHILSLLENDNKTKFHERLSCTSYSRPSDTGGETHHDDDDEKRNTIDKTRRDYIDVFLKKIFVKAEESGCLRDDFAEKHGERLLASASLSGTKADKRTEEEDEKNEMTKKMFVYENGTIRETGETFRDDLLDVGANSRYENLSEITLSLSKNLFAGNTGAHEWTAGFKLAELAINEPGLVYNKTVLELGSGAGLAGVAMLRSQPLRLVLTDKSKESNDNLERNVRGNISSTTSSTKNKNTAIKRESALDALPPMPTGEDVYRKDALASKNRTDEEEMAFTYECEIVNSFVSIRELDWFSDEETLKTAAGVINPDLIVASDVGYDPDLLPGLIDTLDVFLSKRSSNRNYMWLEPETSEDAFDMLFSPRPSEVAKPCIALIVNAKRQEETNAKFDQLLKEKEHLLSFDVTEFALREKAFLGFEEECFEGVSSEEERRDDVIVRVIFASSLPSVRYMKREGSKKDDPSHVVVRRGRKKMASSAVQSSIAMTKKNLVSSSSQKRSSSSRRSLHVVNAAPPTGNERRAMESAKVAARTNFISSTEELDAALTLAGDNLVMLGLISDEACEGFTDEQAKECRQITASMARIARECPDVTFLECDILSSSGAKNLADKLGVKDFPTFQYYKHGDLLWQHSGFGAGSHESIAEGVLYYGDEGAGGLRVQDFLTDISTEADLKDFLELCMPAQEVPGFIAPVEIECAKQLAIVDVSVENDPPSGCLKIFPAVVSLSRNTAGATRWARLIADKNKESKALAKTLKVSEVPSFVFFADGKEVDRYTGSDRMTLMNKVLAFQRANGVKMPQKRTTKRMTTAEAREIARRQREEAKKAGRSQWS
ncbi:unnamed protein product [Bathycoccus prasinos]